MRCLSISRDRRRKATIEILTHRIFLIHFLQLYQGTADNGSLFLSSDLPKSLLFSPSHAILADVAKPVKNKVFSGLPPIPGVK